MLNQRVISFKRQFFTRWHTACSALWLSVVKRIWWIELSWCPKSKSKAIFLAIQNKGKYYNQPMITQTKKNKPPQVRDNAKALVKIEIMQFFRLLFSMVMTGWRWELRRIYIYIYINIMRGKKDVTTFPDKPVSWIASLFRGFRDIYIYSTSGNNFLCKPKYLDWPHDLFCLVQKCTRTGV